MSVYGRSSVCGIFAAAPWTREDPAFSRILCECEGEAHAYRGTELPGTPAPLEGHLGSSRNSLAQASPGRVSREHGAWA